jgi:hypothetical protein
MADLGRLHGSLRGVGLTSKGFDEFLGEYSTPEYQQRVFDGAVALGIYHKSIEEFKEQYPIDVPQEQEEIVIPDVTTERVPIIQPDAPVGAQEITSVPEPQAITQAFDPEGEGYDTATGERLAKEAPLTLPKPDKFEGEVVANEGAFQAWVWHPELNDYLKHDSSRDPKTGLILKGIKHETFGETIKGEQDQGNEIYRGEDGRYYSQPPIQDLTTQALEEPTPQAEVLPESTQVPPVALPTDIGGDEKEKGLFEVAYNKMLVQPYNSFMTGVDKTNASGFDMLDTYAKRMSDLNGGSS